VWAIFAIAEGLQDEQVIGDPPQLDRPGGDPQAQQGQCYLHRRRRVRRLRPASR
jgi:hypothetical protein